MRAKIILGIFIICFSMSLLCSCNEPYYYPNVNTGIMANIDESEESYYGIDHLIILGKNYSLLLDENLNIIHANDDLKLSEPFANFGAEGQYTLYEIETDLHFKVYIDNKNRAVFCEDEFYEECKNYFTPNEPSGSLSAVIGDKNNKAEFSF